MKSFIIEKNNYLDRDIQAFYHCDYVGFNKPTNPDYLNTLKNNRNIYSRAHLQNAINELGTILRADLPKIREFLGNTELSVCVIPRSKQESHYHYEQRLFKHAISYIAKQLNGFQDSTDSITRHTNTRTTHLDNSGYGGDGELPYPGITLDTCTISPDVQGKDILLIDDIYTKTVNIDEDAIQALLTQGARNVYFYAVGRTPRKYG